MRLKKHAIHVAAVATMVGGLVAVGGTGVAGAATVAPSPASCALYIQGPVDPTSGNLPPDLLPLKWTGQDYSVAGEVTKGDGSKLVSDLQNGASQATRFKASLTVDATPVLTQVAAATAATLDKAATTIKIQMKNDKSTALGGSGLAGMPTVQVFEKGNLNAVATKIDAVKATVTGLAAATGHEGASIGNVQPGTLDPPTFSDSTQKLQLNVARNVTGGTFDLAVSAGGSTVPLGTFPAGVSAAALRRHQRRARLRRRRGYHGVGDAGADGDSGVGDAWPAHHLHRRSRRGLRDRRDVDLRRRVLRPHVGVLG